MRTRTVILTLSLGVLALAGCKSTPRAVPQQAFYNTPPPGAVVVPAAPSGAPAQTAPPPLASPPSHLPN